MTTTKNEPKTTNPDFDSDFNYWFRNEAKDLHRFFNLLLSLIPVSIVLALLGVHEAKNIFGYIYLSSNGLLMSVVLQFMFMCYLLWRMIRRMEKDSSSAKWLSITENIPESGEKINQLLSALNFKKLKENPHKKRLLQQNIKSAVKSETYFKYAWMSVWLIWLLIYIVKALAIIGSKYEHTTSTSLMSNLYNLLVCLHIISFAWCFFLLSGKDNSEKSTAATVNWRVFIILFVVLALCICISAVNDFHAFDKTRVMTVVFMLKIIRNTLLSAFFALLVGKLLTEDLRSPYWLRIAVFLYIAIIPLFVVFSDMPELKNYLSEVVFTEVNGAQIARGTSLRAIIENVELILYNISWFLKFCLFLFVAWLIEKDHLLFYFLRFRESNTEVLQDRKIVEELLVQTEAHQQQGAESVQPATQPL